LPFPAGCGVIGDGEPDGGLVGAGTDEGGHGAI
jgi:hypothetical protein